MEGNGITYKDSPIYRQFELARKKELIRRGVLDANGNEYPASSEYDDYKPNKLKSIFDFRNDDIQEKHIQGSCSLWGDLWYENECMCLFGDPNIGKSALAIQIANSVAQIGFNTIYFDFENMIHHYYGRNMTTMQFNMSQNLSVMHFGQNTSFEEMMSTSAILDSIENSFLDIDAPVIVIDDISYICQLKSTRKANMVLRRLRYWINKYHISILVIAHARPHREGTSLALKHLTGDRQLAYAFDSIISLNTIPQGLTTRGETHYIKQLKARNTGIIAGTSNVWTLKFNTHYTHEECDNMVSRLVRSGYQQHEAEGEVEHLRGMQLLHFEFIRNDVSEQSLLFLSPDTPREQLVTFARDCFFKGWSIRDIAAHTALSKSTIHRLLAQPTPPQEEQQQQQPQKMQPQEQQPQEPQPQEQQQEKNQKTVPSIQSGAQPAPPEKEEKTVPPVTTIKDDVCVARAIGS